MANFDEKDRVFVVIGTHTGYVSGPMTYEEALKDATYRAKRFENNYLICAPIEKISIPIPVTKKVCKVTLESSND